MIRTRITNHLLLLTLLGAPVIAAGIYSLAGAQERRAAGPALRVALQDEERPAAPAAGAEGGDPHHGRTFLGVADCVRCHNGSVQNQSFKIGNRTYKLEDDQWVLYGEIPIWGEKDKHQQAYTVLLNERSKRMGEILGVSAIHRDRRCLACHSGYPLANMPAGDDGLIAEELAANVDVNAGVTCEGCHGAAGDVMRGGQKVADGWMGPHQIQPVQPYGENNPWRFLSPEVKEEQFGYWDVRSPASKARICASCHVGNVAQGKVVTHEMYAAGHPPLPGFEIETFIDQMPNHWRELSKKADKVRGEFLANSKDPLYSNGSYDEAGLHRTKSMLVGALVSLSEYLRVTAELTDESVSSPVAKSEWPELSQFDCFACHHDLKDPAWRQVRPPQVGTPGRPPLREWTMALVELALWANETDPAEIEAHMAPLRAAIDEQPFGRPGDVAARAKAAADWAWAEAKELERRSITPAEGQKLLAVMAERASSGLMDYDSARQVAWAFRVVYEELQPDGGGEADKKLGTVLGWFESKEGLDPIEEQLAALDKYFLMDLRAGRNEKTPLPGEENAVDTVVFDAQKVLPYIADHEPQAYQEHFRRIGELLKSGQVSER